MQAEDGKQRSGGVRYGNEGDVRMAEGREEMRKDLGLRVAGVPRGVARRRGRGGRLLEGADGAGDEAAVRDGVAGAEEVRPAAAREAPGGRRAAAGGAGGARSWRRGRGQEGEDRVAEPAGAGPVGQAELRAASERATAPPRHGVASGCGEGTRGGRRHRW